MRKVFLWGLAAAFLAGSALMALPGDSRAQLFNSSKKQEQADPAPNTAKGGTGSSSGTPLYNPGGASKANKTRPVYSPQANTSSTRPYGSATATAQRVPPRSNNGFSRPGSTAESNQDRLIREAAMRRLQSAQTKSERVRANLDRMKAEREAGIVSAPQPSAREDRQFGSYVPEPQTESPSGPMVYDKHNNAKNANPARLFNPAQ